MPTYSNERQRTILRRCHALGGVYHPDLLRREHMPHCSRKAVNKALRRLYNRNLLRQCSYGNGSTYALLTADGARTIGVSRFYPPGTQSFPVALAVQFYCLLGDQTRTRPDNDQLQASLAQLGFDPLPGEHLALPHCIDQERGLSLIHVGAGQSTKRCVETLLDFVNHRRQHEPYRALLDQNRFCIVALVPTLVYAADLQDRLTAPTYRSALSGFPVYFEEIPELRYR